MIKEKEPNKILEEKTSPQNRKLELSFGEKFDCKVLFKLLMSKHNGNIKDAMESFKKNKSFGDPIKTNLLNYMEEKHKQEIKKSK